MDRSQKKLIWCCSHRFRTFWEPRLPPIYGEARAANWAVKSCRFWVRGCQHFKIKTDHKALSHIFTKDWDELSEELQEYVRGLMDYNFTVEYVAGRNNSLADYLSRHPAWELRDEQTEEEEQQEERLIALATDREYYVSSLPVMTDIQACALTDN